MCDHLFPQRQKKNKKNKQLIFLKERSRAMTKNSFTNMWIEENVLGKTT